MPRHLVRFTAMIACLVSLAAPAYAITILPGLLGSDLTDPENDGVVGANTNYNATFNASEEPFFGGAEGAFNVFDNSVGTNSVKWCCGTESDFPTNPIWVSATFSQQYTLTHFTLTSGNDSPEREPRIFRMQGSNDGTNFTDIYVRNTNASSPWSAINQTLRFDGAGVDFATPAAYSTFRFLVNETGTATGARFQLGEVELFGAPVPEPTSLLLGGLGLIPLALVARRKRSKV